MQIPLFVFPHCLSILIHLIPLPESLDDSDASNSNYFLINHLLIFVLISFFFFLDNFQFKKVFQFKNSGERQRALKNMLIRPQRGITRTPARRHQQKCSEFAFVSHFAKYGIAAIRARHLFFEQKVSTRNTDLLNLK